MESTLGFLTCLVTEVLLPGSCVFRSLGEPAPSPPCLVQQHFSADLPGREGAAISSIFLLRCL